MTAMSADIAEVAALLNRADSILFVTGAGISADSGLPTYRGTGGLYNSGTTEEGLRIEDALSADVFAVRPEITWKYLAHIATLCSAAQPNQAHLAIAELERLGKFVMVLTQNIDGLHKRAGSSELIEIHGNLQSLHCTECGFRGPSCQLVGDVLPPRCPRCDGVLKPTVVLFGEALPEGELDRLYNAMDEGFDVVVTIGTSSVFPYIMQPVAWAIRMGIPTVEINPTETTISPHVDFHIKLGAAEALQQLMQKLTESKQHFDLAS